MLTLPTAPGLELLIVRGVGTPATGAGGPYFFGRFLVKLLPVLIMPAGTNGHNNLPLSVGTLKNQ